MLLVPTMCQRYNFLKQKLIRNSKGNELPVPISNYAVMSSIGRELEVYFRAFHSIAASMRCLQVGEVLRRRLGGGVSKFTPLTYRMNLIDHE